MAAADAQIKLFDGFALSRGARIVDISLAGRRVLSYLALNGRCSRIEVAVTLWPDASEAKALGSLRTVLWRIKAIDRDLVAASTDWLHLRAGVHVDVHLFARAADALFSRAAANPPPLADLMVGHLLPGWYDDWVLVERERMRLTQVQALEALAHQLIAQDRLIEAVQAAWAAVQCDPLRESATDVLIRAHLAQRNLVEAVRAYQALRALLWRELRAQPSGELTKLLHKPGEIPGQREKMFDALVVTSQPAESTA
jgi:DNA-binding SARP family transcriptional activator